MTWLEYRSGEHNSKAEEVDNIDRKSLVGRKKI